ncbi:MAG: methyltransferase domain-containing protein [Ignavibacteriae bacterium]|nr:methyltransferase domain-containing protein [Ignavibacteria bacterium]MBI3364620.1 methyltransferase domain-containing protein [Ignavibacteriota bacterium]
METITTDQHQIVAESTATFRSSFVPQQAEPVRVLEHYHRYLYASRFTKGKRVIDIASGEGYGAAFLSLNAESVIGIDADTSAIQQAAQKYAEFQNLRFEISQCESFKTLEQSIDVVVSFETLPLLNGSEAQTQFMQNVTHALTASGVFIVSTPVRSADAQTVTGEQTMPGFSGVELFEFLKKHFQFVRFIGQKPLTMSAMWSLHAWKDDLFRFHVREDLFSLPRDIEMFTEPMHIIAICSDEMLSQDIVNSSKSLYFDTTHTERAREILSQYDEARTQVLHARTRAAQLEQERDMHRDAVVVLTNENLTHLNHIDDVQKQLDERVMRLMDLEQESAERSATLEKLQREYHEQTIWSDKLATDHEILSAKVQDLQAQLEERSTVVTSSGEENEKLVQQVAALRETIAHLHSARDEYAAQLAATTAENEHLHTRIADLQQQYQELVIAMRSSAAEVEQLKSRLAALHALAEEKSRAAIQATMELKEQQEQMNALRQQLQDKVLAAQSAEEVEALRVRAQELERTSVEHATAAATTAQENLQLRTRIEEIEAHTEEFDQKNAEHATVAANITQDNQKLRARIHELQKQYDERAAHARTATQESEKLHSRLTSLQKSMEEKSAMIILLNQEIDGQKEKLQAMERDFDQKVQHAHQWEKENKKRLEHVNELQRKCDEQTYTMRQMKADFEKQTAAFDTFQKSQGDLQQRYNKSQIKVQELTQELAIFEQKFNAIASSSAYKFLASLGLVPKK